MPITKRAIKKLRHDRVRAKQNVKRQAQITVLVKKARKSPTAKNVSLAFAALDKAVKRHIIHKNSAARTKSRLSKLLKK
jgi:small subunit ribosomal protein S20